MFLGEPLAECSQRPLTGFFRTGCCETDVTDHGAHVVCVEVTAEFLSFSKQAGSDLAAPIPEFGFPGCAPAIAGVCAPRWREALEAGAPAKVVLAAT